MTQERFPHDAAYKTFFSDPEMVASLVRNFVPEPFVADMDFSTLERHATGHVTDDLRERHNDIVWRVRWRDSHCYLLLLLEFQSREDWWMAVRILSYTALLWEDLIRAGAIRMGDRLPPVFPLVLYNGGRKWEAPTRLSDLLYPLGGPLASYQPNQRYFLLDEGRVPEETLAESSGVAALLLRLERAREVEDIIPLLDALILELHSPRHQSLQRAFVAWIGRVIFKRAGITETIPEFNDLQEVRSMLADRALEWKNEYIHRGMLIGKKEGISIGRNEGISIGRNEGISIGESKGVRSVLQALLQSRFGVLPQDVAASIADISDTGALQMLTLEVYRVESFPAFRALLAQTVRAKKQL